MPTAILPGQHYRTPSGRRFRVDGTQGPLISAVFTTPSGIDYRGSDAGVTFSARFVQQWCRPVSADAVAMAVGAEG